MDIPDNGIGYKFIVSYSLRPDFAKYSTLSAQLVPYKAIMTLKPVSCIEFDSYSIAREKGIMIINNGCGVLCTVKSSQIVPPEEKK